MITILININIILFSHLIIYNNRFQLTLCIKVITHSSSPSSKEAEMLDVVEGHIFSDLYLEFINSMLPITTKGKLFNPISPSHKVQSYPSFLLSISILYSILYSFCYSFSFILSYFFLSLFVSPSYF